MEKPPVIPATIMAFSESVYANIMRMEVNVTGYPGAFSPQVKTDLVIASSWVNVPHSDNGFNAFVVTNLSYSTVSGSNEVIYVHSDDVSEFFRLIAE